MKVKIDTFSYDYIPEKIFVISDAHFGNKEFALKYWKLLIKYLYEKIVKEKKSWKIILNGDMLETAIDIKFMNGQEIDINEQLDYMTKCFIPFKNNILGSISGNHERRIKNKIPFDIHKEFCNRLGIRCIKDAGVFYFKNDNIDYSICIKHENGNGTRPTSKLNQLLRMKEMVDDMDIYLLGHSHTLFSYKQNVHRFNKNTLKLENIEIYYSYTGHFLYYGGYAIIKGYQPTSKPNCLVVNLDDTKRKIKLGDYFE